MRCASKYCQEISSPVRGFEGDSQKIKDYDSFDYVENYIERL